ncbi:MAG TPA: site-2 protease family protein [Candidatus Dormibacteraeota bacterium]|nr:site-2 protease family protein [Candidatus Dormibacteraeota bacterium]
MTFLRRGAIHLFRFAGIDLFLHWSWFLLAIIEVRYSLGNYSSPGWKVLEYLALFAIVTMHEYGHALACRQVGGTPDQIVLWPLGGVAYVNPPQRPGATLWSIAAGPLVNVALVPVLLALVFASHALGWASIMPNLYMFLRAVLEIDVLLLVFNMMPIYPLDGGQILRSLLWFAVGRARSLQWAVWVGFVGAAGLIFWAFESKSTWIAIIAIFILTNCWTGLRHAQALAKIAKLPRHVGYACPSCHTAPPVGRFWLCGLCKQPFDMFETQAICPNCSARFSTTRCLDCGVMRPANEWVPEATVLAKS